MRRKKDLFCPHCHGRKLWRLESVMLDIQGVIEHAHFEVFICAGCKYSELFATDIEELGHNPKRGIHFIDNEPQAGLR